MNKFTLEIHASRLDSYNDCPLQAFADLMKDDLKALGYQFNDLPRYVTPEVGTAIHSGIAAMHIGDNLEICKSTSLRNLDKTLNYRPDIRFTEKMPNLAYIEQHIGIFIEAYADQVLPKRPAHLIEYGLEGELTKNVTYKTTLDLLTTDYILADLKSGAKITPAYNQLGLYCLLLQREGYRVDRLVLDYILPDKSTKQYVHKPIEYNRDACLFIVKQTLGSLLADFEVFCQTGKLDHIRINPRSATCNKALCPLWGTTTCHLWKK